MPKKSSTLLLLKPLTGKLQGPVVLGNHQNNLTWPSNWGSDEISRATANMSPPDELNHQSL